MPWFGSALQGDPNNILDSTTALIVLLTAYVTVSILVRLTIVITVYPFIIVN